MARARAATDRRFRDYVGELLPDGAVRFPLTKGHFAIVDAADFERVSHYAWHTEEDKRRGKFYALVTLRLEPGRKARRACLKLHNFILGTEAGQLVDHVDGDGLNNRRKNLRPCTHRQNAENIVRSKNQRRGGFKGVSWHPKAKKWEAHIGAGEIKPCGRRRRLYLGLFPEAADAARAYDAAALKYFGEFAALNFPDLRLAERATGGGRC